MTNKLKPQEITDTERLDWMINNQYVFTDLDPNYLELMHWPTRWRVEKQAFTDPREAINAAMQKESHE